AHKIYANDILITSLCGQSSLDLNAYLPMIGHALIESLKMLINACITIGERMFENLEVNADNAYRNILSSPAITTALLPYIGYRKSTEMAAYMRENHCSVIEANSKLKIINDGLLSSVLKPENLLKMGFSLKDIVG
ncbi:MAG: aspartate ammonia-lyase, partial [Bacteroidales bacterium]|nr:aspartate ammonia-lyase [Bacteroidales bacterium]